MTKRFRRFLVKSVYAAIQPLHHMGAMAVAVRTVATASIPFAVALLFGLLSVAFPSYERVFSGPFTELLAPKLMLNMMVAGAILLPFCLILPRTWMLGRPFHAAFQWALVVAYNCAVGILGALAGILLPIVLAHEPTRLKAECAIGIFGASFLVLFLVVLANAAEGKLDVLFGKRLWLRNLCSIIFAVTMAYAWTIDPNLR